MNSRTLKLFVFCCATSYDPDQIRQSVSQQGDEVRVIVMPCSGKLDILYLTKAFETGADGVALMMCQEGECRYLEGNLRAKKRAEAVERLLKETGLGSGRVAVIQLDERGISPAIKSLQDFHLNLRNLMRPSPEPVYAD